MIYVESLDLEVLLLSSFGCKKSYKRDKFFVRRILREYAARGETEMQA
jgi:hypothetical protein